MDYKSMWKELKTKIDKEEGKKILGYMAEIERIHNEAEKKKTKEMLGVPGINDTRADR